MRQQYRDEVLGTTRASFKAFAKTLRAKPFKVAIFGAKDAIEAANTARGADEQIAITQLS
jgi:hypothetical protein